MISAPEQTQFAILRVGKITSREQLRSAGLHNNREMPVSNSDGLGGVRLLYGSKRPENALELILERFGIAPRANAVLASEIILSFSPSMKNQINLNAWAEANMDFIKKRFGEQNILSCQLHTDETTPHIHVLLAPMVEKKIKNKKTGELETKQRLCYRDFLGGNKNVLVQLQDDYAAAMEPYSLVRGMRRSKARHKTIRRFYSEIKTAARDAERYSENLISAANNQTEKSGFLRLIQDAAQLIGDLSKRMFSLIGQNEEKTKIIAQQLAEIERKDGQIKNIILDKMLLSEQIKAQRNIVAAAQRITEKSHEKAQIFSNPFK